MYTMQVDQEWFGKCAALRGARCRSRLEYAPERIPQYQRKRNAFRSSYCSMYVTVEVSSERVKTLFAMVIAGGVLGMISVNKLLWTFFCALSQVCLL